MHDPDTVAFKTRWFTIWHRDPQVGGDEDSCDWFGDRKTRKNGWIPVVFDEFAMLTADAQRAVNFIWWHWHDRLCPRPWWRHPRWHIRHWKIQVYAIQNLQRWAWSRCCRCGGRFHWGEAPISNAWDGDGPRWFKGERGIHHQHCERLPLE
jgi:hypothetical protein